MVTNITGNSEIIKEDVKDSMRLTYLIVVLNIIIFITQAISFQYYCVIPGEPLNMCLDPFTGTFSLVPGATISGALWQFVTYMFLHGDIFHITFNMFVFLIFGLAIENVLGWKRFLTLYIISGIGSALLYLGLTILLGGNIAIYLLGASGAVFGVLTAYAFIFPKSKIWVPYFFIPLPAITVIVLLAALEFFFGVFSLQSGVANFGHLGGLITGAILMAYWKGRHKKRLMQDALERSFEFIWE